MEIIRNRTGRMEDGTGRGTGVPRDDYSISGSVTDTLYVADLLKGQQ